MKAQRRFAIKRKDLGNLSVGSEADVAIFSLRTGDFGFTVVSGKKIKGKQKLEAELTTRAVKIVWDVDGLAAAPYAGEVRKHAEE